MINDNIKKLVNNLKMRFDDISLERREVLDTAVNYISNKISGNQKVQLIFICTHNSRRSHMAQIWAQTAAEYFQIPSVVCYSGGTEATAFNPRAVKTINDAGFKVEQLDESENPVYLVHYAESKQPLKCFSKVYSDEFNPNKNFAAVMTCSHADENCPVVFGAEARFPIRYDDPKEFDGTDLEEAKYNERFEQIGVEMLYTFGKIKL